MAEVEMFPNMTFCLCTENPAYALAAPKYELKVYCGHCKRTHWLAECKEVPYEAYKKSVQGRSLGRVQRKAAKRVKISRK